METKRTAHPTIEKAQIRGADVTKMADELKRWSWDAAEKHPKDRLTDHQALDIAVRVCSHQIDTFNAPIVAE